MVRPRMQSELYACKILYSQDDRYVSSKKVFREFVETEEEALFGQNNVMKKKKKTYVKC